MLLNRLISYKCSLVIIFLITSLICLPSSRVFCQVNEIDQYINQLDSIEESIRTAALNSLLATGNSGVVKLVLFHITNPDKMGIIHSLSSQQADIVVIILKKFHAERESIEMLIDTLESSHDQARENAALLLGMLRTEHSIDPLLRALRIKTKNSSYPYMYDDTAPIEARALVQIGGPAIDKLIFLMKNEKVDRNMRLAAIHSFWEKNQDILSDQIFYWYFPFHIN